VALDFFVLSIKFLVRSSFCVMDDINQLLLMSSPCFSWAPERLKHHIVGLLHTLPILSGIALQYLIPSPVFAYSLWKILITYTVQAFEKVYSSWHQRSCSLPLT
jgi:hypothetical protein